MVRRYGIFFNLVSSVFLMESSGYSKTGFESLQSIHRHVIDSEVYCEVTCLDGAVTSVPLKNLVIGDFCGESANIFFDTQMNLVFKRLPGRVPLSAIAASSNDVCSTAFGLPYRLASELEISEGVSRGLIDPRLNPSFGYSLSRESRVWTNSYSVKRTATNVVVSLQEVNMLEHAAIQSKTYYLYDRDMGAALCVK